MSKTQTMACNFHMPGNGVPKGE